MRIKQKELSHHLRTVLFISSENIHSLMIYIQEFAKHYAVANSCRVDLVTLSEYYELSVTSTLF